MGKIVRISEMIEKYMRKNNMTMKELGEKVGRTEATVSLWISGKVTPRMGAAQQLADLFGITTDELIYGDEANEEPTDRSFASVQEALRFILEQPIVTAFGGYDLNTMTDEEIMDLADDIKMMIEVATRKYRK